MKSKEKYIEEFVGITPKDYGDLGDRHKKALKIFLKYKFNRILDVGCGDGNFSLLIGKACKAEEVYGIEISKQGVEQAKRNRIKAHQLDIDEEDFPFEDNYFDAVFAGEVIEHLYDPDHFLDEVYRVLKPNGIFVLSTPNLASTHNRIALLFGFQPYCTSPSLYHSVGYLKFSHSLDVAAHIRHFTLKSLVSLLKAHGFCILSKKGVNVIDRRNSNYNLFFYFLDKFASFFPSLGYTLLITSQKEVGDFESKS